uniref:Uncharacterized protein n=1 Tax=Promethearchaeum syntrophicum TaxID=2594042 RepID=A0A5B9D8C6_9ARCH|nr:hypothetical protein DSAG12_00676 [Candidatus Prometheoarchaeum syntrophicum]
MAQNIEFLSIFFFEIDRKVILIAFIFLILIVLSFFLLILPDFLPKLMILTIEIGFIFIIFQTSKDVSYRTSFFLDLMQNLQGITEISLEYLDLIIRFEIQIKAFKSLSFMLLAINFFFTLLELF